MITTTATITLKGTAKQVELRRLSEDHAWVCKTPVIATFPSGCKTHEVTITTATERDGKWSLACQGFRNANRATVYAWADEVSATSQW